MLPVNQKQISYSQKVSVQAPPIDLADGKFETRAATLRVGFAVGLFITTALCLWVLLWLWPEYERPRAGHIVGAGLCLSVGGVALWFAVAAVRLQMRAWGDYQAFLEETRTAYLSAYMASDGKQIEQQVRVSELNVRDVRDVLALTCYVYLTGHTSIGQMRGNLMVRAGGRMTSLGQLSDHGAEQAGKVLERAGVLLPGQRGQARRLREAPLDEMVTAVLSKWDRE